MGSAGFNVSVKINVQVYVWHLWFIYAFNCYLIGQVIDNKVADGLQKLKVNHVSTEKCKAAHGNSDRIVPAAHSRHLCAGGIEGKFLSNFYPIPKICIIYSKKIFYITVGG